MTTTELRKLIEESVGEVVQVSEERDAIFEAISLEETLGGIKSINILDKYEKIIEGLIK